MSEKLLRFVTAAVDPDSHHAVGVFRVLRELVDTHALFPHERDRVEELRSWFNHHLERPTRFSKSLRPHRHRKAISWFKSSARAHVDRMRELSQILQHH